MHKITLLLPLTGPFSQQAKAIRQGFITAFYRARGLASAKEGLADSIQVVNTNQQNINQLYQQAVAQGSNIIVGPLTKQHLTQLIQHTTLSVPTLALNSLPIEKPIRHLYLFGLSPFDGAQQAAIKAWRSHHTRAIVIAPDSTWGRNISDVFQQQWQQLGGRVINTIDYGKEASLAQKIEKGLNVNQSYQRYRELRRILGYQRIRFVPRRRKDFNVVFMVATPHMARMIKPLLNYYYAQTIPAYALSQIYQGTPDPKRDHDLNGIIFCDMPWVLQAQHMQPGYLNTLQKRIETLWAANYRNYAKLYALGVDAFDVIGKLNKMTLLPQFGVEGATGTLYLDQRHHLFRQLVWAKMVNGKPKLLNNINRIT